jgi:hypothetical protein
MGVVQASTALSVDVAVDAHRSVQGSDGQVHE